MPRSLDSVDDLSSSSDSSFEDEEEYRLAQKEWEESLMQLQQLFAIVLMPFLGKWLGRKWSYWAYARYLKFGLTSKFLFGDRA